MTPLYLQEQELTWGALALDAAVAPDLPYRIETMAQSASLGDPVPLVEVVESMLTDGSLSVVTSYGNREVTFRVRVSAPDGIALSQAEAAFMAEVMAEHPAPLVWLPPSGDAWPCVFDVVTVKLEGDYSDGWDLDEVMRACLYYTLTFECLPWTRAAETSVVEALPVPEDPDLPPDFDPLNTADSTTGWSGYRNPHPATGAWTGLTLSASGGKVRYTGSLNWSLAGDYPRLGLNFTWSPTLVTDPSKPYFYIDYDLDSYSKNANAGVWVYWNAASDPNQAVQLVAGSVGRERLANGRLRAYFEVPDFEVEDVRFIYAPVRPSTASATWTHFIDAYEIGLVDRLAIDGTSGFQVARTAFVGGTAPTQAAISFDAGADPLLGSTALIYTGGSPVVSMRPLLTSVPPGLNVDAARISGAENNLSAPNVFRVPVSRLNQANYALLARLSKTGTFTVSWTARLVDAAGADMPGSEIVESGSMLCDNDTTDPWMIHHLADIPMPIIALEGGEEHMVEVTLSMATGGAGVLIDEGWLADTDNGSATVVHEPSAFQLATIELRSPQLNSPRPAVIGTWLTYGTQDITRLVRIFGTHLIRPGLMHLFTATDLAKYAACSLEYYERFHTRPGPPRVNLIDPEALAAA